jgi:23S rRNA pseudouridine1911/1915/1917 synthase
MSETQLFEIEKAERIDIYLANALGISRSKVAALIKESAILLNNKPNKTKSTLLKVGDKVKVRRIENTKIPVYAEDLEIVYKDEHIVVVNKPAGIASEPSVSWAGASVAETLVHLGVIEEDTEKLGVVSRLDVGTSGLICLARNNNSFESLKNLYKMREVEKMYLALVRGGFTDTSFTVNAPIGRDKKSKYKMNVVHDGRDAISHFFVLEQYTKFALVNARIETGRTHQIRVHLNAVNHPVLGDYMYGRDEKIAKQLGLNRQFLHASSLSFAHPITGENIKLESELPKDLQSALELAKTLTHIKM